MKGTDFLEISGSQPFRWRQANPDLRTF